MKRITLIIVLIIGWLVSLPIAGFLIFNYIENKTDRLLGEIQGEICELVDYWGGKNGFCEIEYSGARVKHYFERMIPLRPEPNKWDDLYENSFGTRVEQWEDLYGDLSSLYQLNWYSGFPNHQDNGWAFRHLQYFIGDDYNNDYISESYIFPYWVGITKKGKYYGLENEYSVEEMVNSAFEKIKKDPEYPLHTDTIFYTWAIQNEYYYLSKDSIPRTILIGTSIVDPGEVDGFFDRREWPVMYNIWETDEFKVFVAQSQPKTYTITKRSEAIVSNRNSLLLWWGLGITLLSFAIIIPLIVVEVKARKRKRETMHKRLCRLCHPKKFVDYCKREKLEISNEIYKTLLTLDENNQEELSQLANRAVSELGISLIDAYELKELREKANPAKYMKPYLPEKVAIANELHSLLNKKPIFHEDYMQIKNLIQKL